MVLTKTHGIESVLLNHTCTRGPSVTRMRNFFSSYLTFYNFALIAALESNRPAKITGSLVIKDDLVV